VKFWDTSSVVPLCVKERHSASVKILLLDDSSIAVWWATRTECVSAFTRLLREASLSSTDEKNAREVLETLAKSWVEIRPTEPVRRTAERLLAVHALRAADAFQLAAALHWCQTETREMSFISFDTRLREAAYKEGFTVLPAEVL
jgi:uncharacterized protein